MTKRRDVIVLLGASTVKPRAAFAQVKHGPILIGLLSAGSRDPSAGLLGAFKEALAVACWLHVAHYS